MAKERSDPQQDLLQVDAVIKQHDHARTQRGPDGARPFKRERNVNLLRGNKRACCAAKQYCLQTSSTCHSSSYRHKLAERCSHGNLIDSGANDVSGETKEPGTGRTLSSNLCVGRAAFAYDHWNIDQRLNVVNHRGLAEESGLGGKGRLVARLAAMPFYGIKQSIFLSADVRSRAAAKFNVKAHAAAQDIVTQQAFRSRRFNRKRQPLRRERIFAA